MRRLLDGEGWRVFTAAVGVLTGLTILAWLVVAWESNRRQPWLLAPLGLVAALLVSAGLLWWAVLVTTAFAVGTFIELVIGTREAPALRTRYPDAPLSTERWAAAVAAPFRVALAEPWDVVTRPTLRRRYRRMLAREWGITDRASLLDTIDRLWGELRAEHSDDLIVDFTTATARTHDPRGLQPARTVALTPAQAARLREVTAADTRTGTLVIGAYQWWKTAHLIRLACGGATLDLLSPRETRNLLGRVASDLQRRYTGWDQLAAAFHGGWILWHGHETVDIDADRLWAALGMLTTDPASPWLLLPWDMPLEWRSREHSALPLGDTPAAWSPSPRRSFKRLGHGGSPPERP